MSSQHPDYICIPLLLIHLLHINSNPVVAPLSPGIALIEVTGGHYITELMDGHLSSANRHFCGIYHSWRQPTAALQVSMMTLSQLSFPPNFVSFQFSLQVFPLGVSLYMSILLAAPSLALSSSHLIQHPWGTHFLTCFQCTFSFMYLPHVCLQAKCLTGLIGQ